MVPFVVVVAHKGNHLNRSQQPRLLAAERSVRRGALVCGAASGQVDWRLDGVVHLTRLLGDVVFIARMSIVNEYWAGVLQRLEVEVNVFAQLVAHEGEKGRENEAVMARILEALVPQRYGIGSGLLIDVHNHYSHQTDIVVYDQSDEPAVLAQTTQIPFPVESVLACVEIKTTLRGPDIADCLAKARDMRSGLVPARAHPDQSTHPLFVVLAYSGGLKPGTIVKKFMEADDAARPDLVCIVEQGVLLGAAGGIRIGSDEPLDAGIALLRDDGRPVDGEKNVNMRMVYRGRQYPLVNYGDRLLLVEPSRALLLFVEALVRRLAEQQTRPTPVISFYVDDEMRELAWYDRAGEPSKSP
jgi:hypothetical protein